MSRESAVAGPRRVTREAILAQATTIISTQGIASLTFQKLADHLSVSKQAIIYWFPSKQELLRDLWVPAIEAEVAATVEAVARASSARTAVKRFLRSLIAHHLADLGRFRLIYTSTQLDQANEGTYDVAVMRRINNLNSNMYGALETKLANHPAFADAGKARRAAVSIHMAGIGLLTMVALADAIADPLAHKTTELVASMLELLEAKFA